MVAEGRPARHSRGGWAVPMVVVFLGALGGLLYLFADRLGTPLVGWIWVSTVMVLAWVCWRRGTAERAATEQVRSALSVQKMEAVGQLAAGIAHDLNNYLAAIRTHAELLHDRELPRQRIVRQTGSILRTVLKASALIERLLTFSRRQPAVAEVISLNDVVEGFGEMIRGTANSGVVVEMHLHPKLWPVEVGLSQVEQLVMNLVVNGSDAMVEGGTLTIETDNRTAESGNPLGGDAVCLVVADTGVGIEERHRSRLFEPFFTTKAGAGSSGLGLATVYAVVEGANGTIEVESQPGKGSRFAVHLPRCQRPATAHYLPSAERQQLAGTERLLLVDDNEPLAEAACLFLETLGYRVEVESNPALALERARARVTADKLPYDLVITDVQMLEMSGRDLVARLRQLAPIPAIFLSGYTELIEVRQGQASDEAYFIKKPFPARALAGAVRQLLDGSRLNSD